MYLENDIKLINYSKAKRQQIKDKESANLVRIKKYLYSSNFDDDIQILKKEKEKEDKTYRYNFKNRNDLKRNSS